MIYDRFAIKAAIERKFGSMKAMSEQTGCSHGAIRGALSKPNLAGEKAISKAIDVSLWVLWPERWTLEGKRIYPRWAQLQKAKTEAAHGN